MSQDEVLAALARLAAEPAPELFEIVNRLVDLPLSTESLTRVALALGRELAALWRSAREDDTAEHLLGQAEAAVHANDAHALKSLGATVGHLATSVNRETWADAVAKRRCLHSACGLQQVVHSLAGRRIDPVLLGERDAAQSRLAARTWAHIEGSSGREAEAATERLRASKEAERVEDAFNSTVEVSLRRAALDVMSAHCPDATSLDDPRWVAASQRLARIVVEAVLRD